MRSHRALALGITAVVLSSVAHAEVDVQPNENEEFVRRAEQAVEAARVANEYQRIPRLLYDLAIAAKAAQHPGKAVQAALECKPLAESMHQDEVARLCHRAVLDQFGKVAWLKLEGTAVRINDVTVQRTGGYVPLDPGHAVVRRVLLGDNNKIGEIDLKVGYRYTLTYTE